MQINDAIAEATQHGFVVRFDALNSSNRMKIFLEDHHRPQNSQPWQSNRPWTVVLDFCHCDERFISNSLVQAARENRLQHPI